MIGMIGGTIANKQPTLTWQINQARTGAAGCHLLSPVSGQ
jgi:hypothetical protein